MAERSISWWKSRLGFSQGEWREFLEEPIPVHLKRWWFALGGTVAFLFGIQLITGILLAFYYEPTVQGAYRSVEFITFRVPFGWWIRGLHRGAASLMIAALLFHSLRVFFTAAFRRPRELNWFIGVLLLFFTLAMGFTGYSLVYEQLSYWGATVGSNIVAALPIIGSTLAHLLRGGETVGEATLRRFFVLHTMLIPALMAFFVFLHLWLIRRHGVSPFDGHGRNSSEKYPFFPDHFYTELIIGLVLLVGLTLWILLYPPQLGAPANPALTPEHIKPEWYFYFTFRWLKMTSFRVGVWGLFGGALLFFLVPIVDHFLEKWYPRKDLLLWFGSLVFLGTLVLTLWEVFS